MHFRITDASGKVNEEQNGKARVGEDSISLLGEDGRSMEIPFRQITGISDLNREMTIATLDRSAIISKAGFKHDDLRRALMRGRNALLLKDRFIDEKVVRQPLRSAFEVRSGPSVMKGDGELTLFDRSLVVSPDDGRLFRIRLAQISRVEKSQTRLVLHHRHGTIELFKLGGEIDPLTNMIRQALAVLHEEARALLRETYLQVSADMLERASALLMDGRAASRKEVEAIGPELWKALVKRVKASDLEMEYDVLTSTSGDHVRLGLAKGLMNEEPYLWFLAAMGKGSGDFQAIAFEAQSVGDQGRATYIFSFESMADFAGYDDVSAVLEVLAEALMSIGLRREPIYMSEVEMHRPENSRYLNALAVMPELVALRKAFIGRAAHDDGWAEAVGALVDRAGGRGHPFPPAPGKSI